MTRRITPQSTLDNLRKEAKRWLKELRADNAAARERLKQTWPEAPEEPGLRDIQHALAREHGLPGWTSLKEAVSLAKFKQLADDTVAVYATGDKAAMQRINAHYRRSSTVEDLRATVWRLVYKVRQGGHFGTPDAKEMIARSEGFNNWTALCEAVTQGKTPQVPTWSIDASENRITPLRNVTASEWQTIIGVAKEQRIAAIEASGHMTDEALRQIAELDHVTTLRLGGSREVSDDGLQYLARMPQLECLELNEYPGGKLTDRGLEVLRYLPNLRIFDMCWQRGVSDAGVANLQFCEKLESVNLMGTPTGDGAVEALRGKPNLRRLSTGRLLTDAGLAHLRDFPMFRTWHEPTHLLIDGPFTNAGLATLAGLDGIESLDLFWHVTGITTAAFKVLPHLPHLASLGCDGALSDDEAMSHIVAIPRLRKLRAQGSTATDDGFIALSRSASLENFWGREAPNLTGRGFIALSTMPSLRALGISCKGVDDEALSHLPRFPALQELTPIDVKDEGFRHVGKCEKLERLSCMYCRDTTDIATAHVAGLRLKSYYAGLTQITDHSLEIMGRMETFEKIEFYETKNVTGAGLAHLKDLPRLHELKLSGLPNVTFADTQIFPERVRVVYYV